MDLNTVIHCPDSIRGGRSPWTGTLAEAIRWDYDMLTQDAELGGLPMTPHNDWCRSRTEADPDDCVCDRVVDFERLTLDQWRDVLDDPNAEIIGE